jgi:sugar O-acyltransferase (sialic acid O-acetyltransferase NeuD family)
MQIKTVKILGLSEATLTMLFDILESNGTFPSIEIINNIGYEPVKEYVNKNFDIKIKNDLTINEDDYYILGATKKETKIKVLNFFNNIQKDKFLTLVSKNSEISSTSNLGYGNVINCMVCIAGHTTLDDFVFVNRNVSIGHHVKIGKYTTINPGVNIAGNVVIGESCQIGIGVNIFDGITIGNNVTIGGGSLVTKDLPDNVVAYGNPCKIIKKIN